MPQTSAKRLGAEMGDTQICRSAKFATGQSARIIIPLKAVGIPGKVLCFAGRAVKRGTSQMTQAGNKATISISITFERESCPRCGGTGAYLFGVNATKGVCFKCHGAGRVLSRRGIYARGMVRKLFAEWGIVGTPVLDDEKIAALQAVKGTTVMEAE